MTALTPFYFKNLVAKTFIEYTLGENSTDSLYMFMSRQLPWSAATEPYPPAPTQEEATYKEIWDNFMAAKKVNYNNVKMVVRNNTWTANNVYIAYDDQNPNLLIGNTQFYVINSNNDVYKCLSNNASANSTIEPVGLGSVSNNYIQTTSDGYQWKYMLYVDEDDDFFNRWWIPAPIVAPISSTQEIIKNAAVDGSIDVIKIENSGNNYIDGYDQFIVNITGDGMDANACVNIFDGHISEIKMINRGQNYTYANVEITATTGSGAVLRAVMGPKGGHGYDANKELGAQTIMIVTNLTGDESGYFTTTNDFRQNGLLHNPLRYDSNTVIANVSIANTATIFNVSSGIGNYVLDEYVYQGNSLSDSDFSGIVIDFNSSTNVLRINNTRGTIQPSKVLYGVNSSAQRYILQTIDPDFKKYSGNIIYIDNEPAITRTPIQNEKFQYILRF
jgi:hypothetical protein